MDTEKTTKRVVTKDIAPRQTRRAARAEFRYIEPLEEPGSLYNAQVHGSAQRLLKVHRITKYVKFCRDCSLPQETPAVVIPFNWIDEQLDFGVGIYLYFYYIKFLIVMSLICVGLSSISTIVFSKSYVDDITDYCQKYATNSSRVMNDRLRVLDSTTYTFEKLTEKCEKYISVENSTDDVFKADWLSDMSCYNLDAYYDVFQYQAAASQKDNIDYIILDYSFMYFLTGVTVLIANFLFIQIVSLLSEYEDFKATTPADYAVLVRGVPKPTGNEEMKAPLIKMVKEIEHFTTPYKIYQIIPCLRIGDIYELAKKKYKEETKIYHANHFEKQLKLNKDNNFSKENNNLHYFESQLFVLDKKIPVSKIEEKVEKYRNKLNNMKKDLYENSNNYNGGTFFLIFNSIQMKDDFVEFFPKSHFLKFMWRIRYFFENYIFTGCVNENRKNMSRLKTALEIVADVEPFEVEWENMGFSRFQRNIRLFISVLAFLVLIVVTLGIIIVLNYVQRKIAENQKDFWKYVISLLISIILAVTTYVGKLLFKKLTYYEKIEVTTNFFISYSIKLTLFQFITISVLPVVSNMILGDDGSDILVNNLLMIFITNIFLPPLLFYLGPDLAIKLIKRSKVMLELNEVKLEKSTYTQGELNEIFENPDMEICSKYSYVNNVFLTSLFYMSVFPIGMIFGFASLILAYVSETFYIGLYKRPEILNSSLCRFYVSNFKWSMFIFAIGNYIFLGSTNENQRKTWSLINLIVFSVISLIPYQAFKFHTLGESEGRTKPDTYEDNYIFFSTDYEKLNPFTRKEAYTNYFNRLINSEIIDPKEGKRIINKIQNTDEFSGYLHTRRHLNNHSACQEMSNLYMKNKIEKKIKFMFEDEGAKSTIQGIKTLITDTSEEQEEKYTEEDYKIMSKMNKILEDFSYTNTGICNALIFLDEKSNINDRSDNYNFNPWKAEWLFTPKYKEKRKEMIHQIRAKMDYRAEISDEEDSVIKYDDIKSNNSMLQKLNEDISKQPSENEIIKSEEEKIVINKELSLEATKTGNTIDDKNLEANSNEKLEINNINNIETENNEKPIEANDSQIKLWEKNYPLNLNNDNENNINNK
jgi:hypothetical protein